MTNRDENSKGYRPNGASPL